MGDSARSGGSGGFRGFMSRIRKASNQANGSPAGPTFTVSLPFISPSLHHCLNRSHPGSIETYGAYTSSTSRLRGCQRELTVTAVKSGRKRAEPSHCCEHYVRWGLKNIDRAQVGTGLTGGKEMCRQLSGLAATCQRAKKSGLRGQQNALLARLPPCSSFLSIRVPACLSQLPTRAFHSLQCFTIRKKATHFLAGPFDIDDELYWHRAGADTGGGAPGARPPPPVALTGGAGPPPSWILGEGRKS